MNETKELSPTAALLKTHLELTVPFVICGLQMRGGPTDADFDRCRAFAVQIGQFSDQVMYGGPQCRPTLQAIVEGLAVLAFCPGGVTLNYLGLHFEVKAPEGAPA